MCCLIFVLALMWDPKVAQHVRKKGIKVCFERLGMCCSWFPNFDIVWLVLYQITSDLKYMLFSDSCQSSFFSKYHYTKNYTDWQYKVDAITLIMKNTSKIFNYLYLKYFHRKCWSKFHFVDLLCPILGATLCWASLVLVHQYNRKLH